MKSRRDRIIWAAGFIDGEGSIGLARQKSATSAGGYYFKVTLQVGQRYRRPLDELAELFGGRVFLTKAGYFQWYISSRRAAAALEELKEFLVLKGKQAEVVLEFQGRRHSQPVGVGLTTTQRRLDLHDWKVMRKLNKKRILVEQY